MSTITRERLLKIQQWRETYGPGSNVVLPAEEAEELARIALASLESEPVAWRYRTTDINGNPNARWSFSEEASLMGLYQPLYTAPPAPVVPDKMTYQDGVLFVLNNDMSSIERGTVAMRAWNACRAAMLQVDKSVSTELQNTADLSTNSPVIQDGWIKCSERMPEDEQEVLTRNRMGHCFVSFFDEHSGLFFDKVDVAAACCIEHILVTHWMPLPAAPKQETL